VLLATDTLPWLRDALAASGLPASSLVLELTETSPVRDRTVLSRALERLRHAGIGVLLDDLGLADPRRRLLDLPFTGVKLDRHFVAALPTARRARAEAERIVSLAARRGLTVTAEGVASPRLWRALAASGVDAAQGFAVGRPLPAAALPAWAAAWRGAGRPPAQPA